MADASRTKTDRPASDGIIVSLTLQLKPGTAEQVRRRMLPAIRLTRREPGNIDFRLFAVNGHDDRFVIFEHWRDKAALEWHQTQEYTRAALRMFQELLIRPLSQADDAST